MTPLPRPPQPRPVRSRVLRLAAPYAGALAAVGLACVAGQQLAAHVELPNISLVFLLAVLLCAVRAGIGPAVFASLLSFLAYNYFFLEPLHTFTVARPHELLALVVYLVIAVVTAAVAGQAREQARAASGRMLVTRRLYEFTRRLFAVTGTDAVADVAAGELAAALGRPAALLLRDGDGLRVAAASSLRPDAAAVEAARLAAEGRSPAGAGWLFLPLGTARGPLGAAGVALAGSALEPEDRALFETLAEQAAAALDHTRVVEEAASARRAAEAERIRNTLLASVSHDFRTPLASIQGAASSLAEFGAAMKEADREDLLRQIREEAEHLDGMVRNLLAITRVESGALELNRTWVDLREVVDRVIAAQRRRGTGGSFSVSYAPDMTLLRADQSLLDQAIDNLVGNAVHHGGASVHVAVEAWRDRTTIGLSVTDDGPGIAPDLLPRVFEKFVSGRVRSDGGEGTGLGLAIARGIVEAHGGRITVQSPVDGDRGTRFTLFLPVGGETSDDTAHTHPRRR